MEFSKKEIALIKSASRKMKQSTFSRIFLLVTLVILLSLMLTGYLSGDHFAYLSVFLVIASIAQPELGSGPKYEELVSLLNSKLSTGGM